ncbi:MAG: hypothetical protein PHT48_12860 [Dechloromonas sp.]|nr:hypothetical protein [Dechloromonas sp.]
MFGIKKFIFGDGLLDSLPADVKQAVSEWQALPAVSLDSTHFLTRYVVIDVATDGPKPDANRLTGIAAMVVYRGEIAPGESLFVDFAASTADANLQARQWAALLRFIGQSPLVSYHQGFGAAFIQQGAKRQLGIAFEPPWLDLAWLLPAMFAELNDKPQPLDEWVQRFGLDLGSGRRQPMENAMILARMMQMILVRAHGKGVGTATALIEESHASSVLRRTL